MKGVWSNCKLAKEPLSVEITTASVFGPPAPMAASLPTIRLSRNSSLRQLQNFKHVISETTTSLLSFLNKVLRVESHEVLLGLLKPQSWLPNKASAHLSTWVPFLELISEHEKQLLRVVTREGVGVGVGSLPSLLRAVTPSRPSAPVMVHSSVKQKDLPVISNLNNFISRI